MKTVLRILSSFLVLFAFVALARLLFSDLRAGFLPSADQQRAGSWALIIIGASYICVQLANRAGLKDRLKGVLLGLAFVLWGGEHFAPAGAPVGALDFLVVTIFVVDLGLMIRTQLAAGPAPSKRP
jgi:hypothetical protein